METKTKRSGLLLLRKADEKKEIEFELRYLLSLTMQERFQLMRNKSREMIDLLEQNGHRKTAEVIKRKSGRAKDLEDLKYLKKIKARKK